MIQAFIPDFDYERRVEDVARLELDDIGPCAAADFRVRWMDGVPHLVLGFHLLGQRDQPAVAVRLTTMPNNHQLTGDRLRGHIRRSVENYLQNHGIKLPVRLV